MDGCEILHRYMVYPLAKPMIYSVSELPNGCELVQDSFHPLYVVYTNGYYAAQ